MNDELKIFKSFKDSAGYTYSEIAKLMGYSKPFIWQLINGKRKLSYEQALMLSSIFNMPPDDLFYTDFRKRQDIINKIKNIEERKRGKVSN